MLATNPRQVNSLPHSGSSHHKFRWQQGRLSDHANGLRFMSTMVGTSCLSNACINAFKPRFCSYSRSDVVRPYSDQLLNRSIRDIQSSTEVRNRTRVVPFRHVHGIENVVERFEPTLIPVVLGEVRVPSMFAVSTLDERTPEVRPLFASKQRTNRSTVICPASEVGLQRNRIDRTDLNFAY